MSDTFYCVPRSTTGAEMTGYEDFQFHCAQCGACCRGEQGYVYLTFLDVIRLSAFFDRPMKDILAEFTYYAGEYAQLFVNFPCPFQKGNLCSVYPVRPIQCVAYPFWGTMLTANPLDNSDNPDLDVYCEPVKNFRPLKLLSQDSIQKIQEMDEALYNMDHLEILVAMGYLTEEDIQELGFDWESSPKAEK